MIKITKYKKRPKFSPVWKYYEEKSKDSVICKLCRNTYSRKGRCTSALKSHLRSKHPDEYLKVLAVYKLLECKLKDDQETKKEGEDSRELNNIEIGIDAQESCLQIQNIKCEAEAETENDITPRHSFEIDRLITELIIEQNLPFSFVEWPAFKRLMQIANPEYEMGTREFYTYQLLHLIYPRVNKRIRLLLEEFSTISIAIDIWSKDSDSECVPLLSITAHGIDAEFNRIKLVLRCEAIETFHESHYLINLVLTTLAHWNIDKKAVNCFISNNSCDAFLEVRHFPCAFRTVEMCVDELLKNVDIIVLLRKCRVIATHFKTSIGARERLKEIQETSEQSTLPIIGDIEDRWNTTYLMLERFIQAKESLIMHSDSNLLAQDWLTLENCLAILKPLYEISQQLNDPHTCISSVIPLFHTLKLTLTMQMNNVNHDTGPIIQSICDTLHYRFSDIENNLNYILATYLDPRYKLKFFDSITTEKIEEEISKLVLQNIDLSTKTTEKHSNGESRQTVNQSIQERLRMFLDSDEDVEDCDKSIEQASLKSLLFQYNNEKRIKTHNDPLKWWRSNTGKYGPLVPIAQQYLSTPATSVFYKNQDDGFLFDPVKFNLDHKMAEKILFVKYNLPLVNFQY